MRWRVRPSCFDEERSADGNSEKDRAGVRQNSQRLEALRVIQAASIDVGGVVWGSCVSIGKVREHPAMDVFEPLYELVDGSEKTVRWYWGERAA